MLWFCPLLCTLGCICKCTYTKHAHLRYTLIYKYLYAYVQILTYCCKYVLLTHRYTVHHVGVPLKKYCNNGEIQEDKTIWHSTFPPRSKPWKICQNLLRPSTALIACAGLHKQVSMGKTQAIYSCHTWS
uniref:Secreted protein n=1 Tax=Anguilla anguilla TaxID=7936 RepID=A0A0E9XN02_ANGAN